MSDRAQDVEGAGDTAFQDAVDVEDPQGVESLSTTEINVETTFIDPGPTGGARTNVEVGIELEEEPVGRAQRQFARAGMRQSTGGLAGNLGGETSEADDLQDEGVVKTHLEIGDSGKIVVDGRDLPIRKLPEHAQVQARLWDKTKREDLTPEARLAFNKAATSYILPKNNKLSAPTIVTSNNDELLAQVENLNYQLKMIRNHLTSYDIGDVMTIVAPVNVQTSSKLERRCFNVFDDYNHLHPVHVANSNTWYHLWAGPTYIRENMALTLSLIQHNTDEELWLKCLEKYEDFEPSQQGGPLMLILVLQRIQDRSEQTLDFLKKRVSNLNISKLKGEDVEQAVRLIKSTYKVLKCSSTEHRSYVPRDFTKVAFCVLQTTTVDEFNYIFRDLERDVQVKADMAGVQPSWPSITKVINLATTTHRRLKATGVWDEMTRKRGKACALMPNPNSKGATTYAVLCWNCGKPHHLKDCKLPIDQAKVDKARAAFRSKRKNSTSNKTNGKPRFKSGSDGKPLVLNKKGACVLDQKKWRALSAHFADKDGSTKNVEEASKSSESIPNTTEGNGPYGNLAMRVNTVKEKLSKVKFT